MKIKSNNKGRNMHVDRELTKTSLRIKKKFRVTFSTEDCLPFSFQGTFFPTSCVERKWPKRSCTQ